MAISITVSKRARAMRVAVYPGGEVRVTVPRRASQDSLHRFLARYRDWIARHVRRLERQHVIHADRARIREYKASAQKFAEARCAHYAKLYGVTYTKITIRAQKTRWGSCSRKGNLSFNYKIALLPPEIAEYIIVHEICHLLVFDHSRRFWENVARQVPEHKKLRMALRSISIRFS